MRCFVTVGTTKFDALVAAVCSPDVVAALLALGIRHVVVQYGHGDPPSVVSGLTCEAYRFKPSLAPDFAAANLVLSHAGYGCLMEALSAPGAPWVVAVTNGLLMDNHQTEIASELARRGHAAACEPAGLAATLRGTDFAALTPLPPARPEAYAAFIDGLVGVRSK